MKMLNYVLIYFCSCSWLTFWLWSGWKIALLRREPNWAFEWLGKLSLYKMYIYIFVYGWMCLYIFRANPRLIGSDSSGINPASLSGTLLWFSPQILENSWSICSDWSHSTLGSDTRELSSKSGSLGLLSFPWNPPESPRLWAGLYCQTGDECSPHFAMIQTLVKLL